MFFFNIILIGQYHSLLCFPDGVNHGKMHYISSNDSDGHSNSFTPWICGAITIILSILASP